MVVTLLTLAALLLLLLLFQGESSARTIVVDGNGQGNYTKLQDAVQDARAGDTIRVWEGDYIQGYPLDVTERINIVGNGSRFSFLHNYVTIFHDGVTIENLGFIGANYGIFIEEEVGDVVIRNCDIRNYGYYGIYCSFATWNILIDKCVIRFCLYDGVRAQGATGVKLVDCLVEECQTGVSLNGDGNEVRNSSFVNNWSRRNRNTVSS